MSIQTVNPATNKVVKTFEEMSESAIDAAIELYCLQTTLSLNLKILIYQISWKNQSSKLPIISFCQE